VASDELHVSVETPPLAIEAGFADREALGGLVTWLVDGPVLPPHAVASSDTETGSQKLTFIENPDAEKLRRYGMFTSSQVPAKRMPASEQLLCPCYFNVLADY
jgi:hypothetical protein